MKRVVSFICILLLVLPMSAKINVKGATLANPRIVKSENMDSGQKVTWDCIWFGTYPQAEVVPVGEYTAIRNSFMQKGDIIQNDALYKLLQSTTGWNSNGEIVLNGNKYLRIRKTDATISDIHDYSVGYQWKDSTTYHYFKWEPIKWRVLSVNGDDVFLLADKALDDRCFEEDYDNWDEDYVVTWETCTLRSWLNGYGFSINSKGKDYTKNNFIDAAFNKTEKDSIVNTNVGNNTRDRVFLLSETEIYSNMALAYGFEFDNLPVEYDEHIYDEARRCKSSSFAKAMGVSSWTMKNYVGNCWWWLRSKGDEEGVFSYVDGNGYISNDGWDLGPEIYAIRPALHLNISGQNVYLYAGTVCSDGTKNEINVPDTNNIKDKHTFTYIKGVKTATYFASGYTGDKVCSICGKIINRGRTIAKKKLGTPKVKAGKKRITVKYKKVSGATGFQIRYKKEKGKWVIKKYKGNKSCSKVFKKLKKGKKYSVQIRVVKGRTYSNWSKIKTVKVK